MYKNRSTFLAFLSLISVLASCLAGCNEPSKIIAGRVDLATEFKSTLAPNAALYIVARRAGETSGPPIAVKRFTQPMVFPIEFQLSGLDVMMPDTVFEGKMTVTARIAQSGSATPVQAGDIEGAGDPNPVSVGDSLKILLSKKR